MAFTPRFDDQVVATILTESRAPLPVSLPAAHSRIAQALCRAAHEFDSDVQGPHPLPRQALEYTEDIRSTSLRLIGLLDREDNEARLREAATKEERRKISTRIRCIDETLPSLIGCIPRANRNLLVGDGSSPELEAVFAEKLVDILRGLAEAKVLLAPTIRLIEATIREDPELKTMFRQHKGATPAKQRWIRALGDIWEHESSRRPGIGARSPFIRFVRRASAHIGLRWSEAATRQHVRRALAPAPELTSRPGLAPHSRVVPRATKRDNAK